MVKLMDCLQWRVWCLPRWAKTTSPESRRASPRSDEQTRRTTRRCRRPSPDSLPVSATSSSSSLLSYHTPHSASGKHCTGRFKRPRTSSENCNHDRLSRDGTYLGRSHAVNCCRQKWMTLELEVVIGGAWYNVSVAMRDESRSMSGSHCISALRIILSVCLLYSYEIV